MGPGVQPRHLLARCRPGAKEVLILIWPCFLIYEMGMIFPLYCWLCGISDESNVEFSTDIDCQLLHCLPFLRPALKQNWNSKMNSCGSERHF